MRRDRLAHKWRCLAVVEETTFRACSCVPSAPDFLRFWRGSPWATRRAGCFVGIRVIQHSRRPRLSTLRRTRHRDLEARTMSALARFLLRGTQEWCAVEMALP